MLRQILIGIVTLSIMFTIGCDSDDKKEVVDESITMNTEDIGIDSYYFNLNNGSFSETYDLKFEAAGQGYQIVLNNAAGVYAMEADTNDFDAAIVPSSPFSSDTADASIYVIGENWMDENTYDPSDHSIDGNGTIYFVRTANYEIVKLEVISGSPTSFIIKYAIESDTDIFGDAVTKTINYSSSSPEYFDFTGESEITDSNWDVAILTMPVYAPGMGNIYMPTIKMNFGRNVKVSVLTDTAYEEITEVPSDIILVMDSAVNSHLGYEGVNEVLVYHPEPPYNHKVIVENPDYIYIFETPEGSFKLKFDEYGSGALIFTYVML
ncbi:MAG: hypothetical protein HQ509_12230 [Candidatus Marinimicrobia bacterium]|nr:hypothetical protein [Candidatus Neomarinimicrobiota bacterium]